MRISVDFALIHKALLMIVKEFDGVLDGDHVLFTFGIDFVEHGSKRGGLAGTGWAGDENEPARFVAQSLHYQRQSQSIESFNFPRNGTEDRAYGSPLIETVAAETGQVLQAKGEVQLQILFKAVLLRVRQNAVRQGLGVRGRQRRHVERPESSVDAHARSAVRGDVEVAASH